MSLDSEQPNIVAAEQQLEAAVENLMAAITAASKNSGEPLPDTVMRGIINLVNQAKSAFAPYENTLTPADRKRLVGIGYKNYGFIEQAYASAAANPKLVPSYLNVNSFKIDIDDFSRKRNLDELVKQFELLLSDSMFVASDKAYHDAVEYYNAVKEAARQRVSGAEAAYNALKDYFKRAKSSSTEPTEAALERDARALLHGKKEGKIIIENENPTLSGGKHKVIDDIHSDQSSFKENIERKGKE
ncbi:MAG: hypothetical protein LBH61_00835 [Dysgonamonadaceae bacterium]|jgi:hypothetical protein|nr:hypothetical protein [Dysgonamonadaceae bacterium]